MMKGSLQKCLHDWLPSTMSGWHISNLGYSSLPPSNNCISLLPSPLKSSLYPLLSYSTASCKYQIPILLRERRWRYQRDGTKLARENIYRYIMYFQAHNYIFLNHTHLGEGQRGFIDAKPSKWYEREKKISNIDNVSPSTFGSHQFARRCLQKPA